MRWAETRVRAQDEILTRRERSTTKRENDENFDTESFEYRHKVDVRSSGKKLRGDSFKEKFQEHFKKGRVDVSDELRSSIKKLRKDESGEKGRGSYNSRSNSNTEYNRSDKTLMPLSLKRIIVDDTDTSK